MTKTVELILIKEKHLVSENKISFSYICIVSGVQEAVSIYGLLIRCILVVHAEAMGNDRTRMVPSTVGRSKFL